GRGGPRRAGGPLAGAAQEVHGGVGGDTGGAQFLHEVLVGVPIDTVPLHQDRCTTERVEVGDPDLVPLGDGPHVDQHRVRVVDERLPRLVGGYVSGIHRW